MDYPLNSICYRVSVTKYLLKISVSHWKKLLVHYTKSGRNSGKEIESEGKIGSVYGSTNGGVGEKLSDGDIKQRQA